MIRFLTWHWILIALAMGFGVATGQVWTPTTESQRVPKSHIIDDARLFGAIPARLAAMESRLKQIEEKYHFPIYLVIYDTLIGSDVGTRSQQFQDKWIGNDDPGWVAVFETDSGDVGLGVHPVKQVVLESGSRLPALGPVDLSLLEQSTIWQVVQQSATKPRDPRDKVEALVNELADQITRNFEARLAPPPQTARLRTIIFTVGLIAASGLIGLLVIAWLRRSDSRARQRYVFPDVSVGIRLGASYGGGKISSMDFSESRGPTRP